MNTSKSCDAHCCTTPVSMVSRCKLVSGC